MCWIRFRSLISIIPGPDSGPDVVFLTKEEKLYVKELYFFK
jgi:hypothetical protein